MVLALASLLSLERMFERDFEDGALDLLMLGPAPAEAVAAAKCLAHWLVAGAPLALAAPLAAVALGAPLSLAPLIFATAAIGGIAFAFVGGTGAALALGSRRGGMIIAVIVLPRLLSPPVIFGGGALKRLTPPACPGATGSAAAGRLRSRRGGHLPFFHGRRLPQRAVLIAALTVAQVCNIRP